MERKRAHQVNYAIVTRKFMNYCRPSRPKDMHNQHQMSGGYQRDGEKIFYDFPSRHLLPAGKTGARHEWQKHWSTESRTSVINMILFSLINRARFALFLLFYGNTQQGWGRRKERKSQLRRKELKKKLLPALWKFLRLRNVLKDVNTATLWTELRKKVPFRCKKDFRRRFPSLRVALVLIMRSGVESCKRNFQFIVLSVGMAKGLSDTRKRLLLN